MPSQTLSSKRPEYAPDSSVSPSSPPQRVSDSYGSNDNSHTGRRGFAQLFGLHPAVAFLTFIVDSMLFGEEGLAGMLGVPSAGASIGIALTISTIAACILGVIAYLAQRKWYGDDKQSAFIKALILAFLTAIPTNIPAFVYLSAGVVGFFRRKN